MKRYITYGGVIWSKDTITREDLVRVKNGSLDMLIDTVEGKYFDADDNSWKEIPHD